MVLHGFYGQLLAANQPDIAGSPFERLDPNAGDACSLLFELHYQSDARDRSLSLSDSGEAAHLAQTASTSKLRPPEQRVAIHRYRATGDTDEIRDSKSAEVSVERVRLEQRCRVGGRGRSRWVARDTSAKLAIVHAADLYEQTRERVIAVSKDLDPGLAVPACPGWTVHDVVCHLVGLAADVATARVDGYAGDRWTAQQVEARSGDTMSDLIDEWDQVLPKFLEINRDLAASDLPEMINHVLGPVPKSSFESAFHVDLVHHEHDLLGAAGTPRRVALPADIAAMRAQLTNVRLRFVADRLPTLRLSPSDADRAWDIGNDAPVAWVSGSVIDFLRSFGGRRTFDEIRSLEWSGEFDGMAERMVLPFFEAPPTPIPGG